MQNLISFVHITGRSDPKWEWYCDAICNQASPEELRSWQFIFVDRLLWDEASAQRASGSIKFADPQYHDHERRRILSDIIGGRFQHLHIPVLPNPYQGPFRKTKRDWFFAGASRNTGIVASAHSYVMFCDDLAVPSPQWLSQVRHAAEHHYLLAGMYAKKKKLVVSHGIIASAEDFPPGLDSRYPHGSDGGIVKWHGSGVFGCSFGVPMDQALDTDGCGYEVAAQGADDYCWGIRLERAGLPVFLNRNCWTTEDEDAHHIEPSLPRESKLVPQHLLPDWYTPDLNPMSDHVHLNRLWREKNRILPLHPMGLRSIRESFLSTGLVPIPDSPSLDWRDNSPLSDLP